MRTRAFLLPFFFLFLSLLYASYFHPLPPLSPSLHPSFQPAYALARHHWLLYLARVILVDNEGSLAGEAVSSVWEVSVNGRLADTVSAPGGILGDVGCPLLVCRAAAVGDTIRGHLEGDAEETAASD